MSPVKRCWAAHKLKLKDVIVPLVTRNPCTSEEIEAVKGCQDHH